MAAPDSACRKLSSWRSSKWLIVITACVALFTETLLYGIIVPILPYMLEDRLHVDPSRTQDLITWLLSVHALATLVSAPFIASFADRSPNRKLHLLVSLVICVVGTALVAGCLTVWALYLGRILQGIAGSIAWIVCLNMLSSVVDKKHVGKTIGICMSFIMTGTVSGPFIGGTLHELVGYWPTWSVPLGILLLDVIARLVVIDPPVQVNDVEESPSGEGAEDEEEDSATTPMSRSNATETNPLLPQNEIRRALGADQSNRHSTRNFYVVMLRDARVIASLIHTTYSGIIMAGLNTTLPLHLRDIFNWGPSSVGLTFFILQTPPIFLVPVSGWLRDIVGLRYPTTAAWTLLYPILFALGVPGDEHFPGANTAGFGRPLFLTCIAGTGVVFPFIQGAGFMNVTLILKDMEAKEPLLFGEHGGRSRAFALSEGSYYVGMLLGPILTGFLIQRIGFFWLNVMLAGLCFGVACLTVLLFVSKRSHDLASRQPREHAQENIAQSQRRTRL